MKRTKCDILREIRRKVCELNGLEYTEKDCPHADGCRKGSCPACDAQLVRINRQLEAKRLRGETVRYAMPTDCLDMIGEMKRG